MIQNKRDCTVCERFCLIWQTVVQSVHHRLWNRVSFGFSANGAACFVKNPDNKAFKQTMNFPAFGHNQRKDSSNKPWIFPPLDTTLPSDRLLFCSFPAFRHKQNLVLIDWLLTSVPCWRLSLGVSVLLLRIVINNDCNNLSSLPYSGFDRQLSFLTCANRSTQTVIMIGLRCVVNWDQQRRLKLLLFLPPYSGYDWKLPFRTCANRPTQIE